MAKIKEIIDSGLEAKLKRFETLMGYSLSDKTKLEYIKIAKALIDGNLPVRSRSRYLQARSVAKKLKEQGLELQGFFERLSHQPPSPHATVVFKSQGHRGPTNPESVGVAEHFVCLMSLYPSRWRRPSSCSVIAFGRRSPNFA